MARPTTTKAKGTRRKAAPKELGPCAIPGCPRPGTSERETPRGIVVVCGRCAELAEESLLDERVRVDRLDVAASAAVKAQARQRLRRLERVHATLR